MKIKKDKISYYVFIVLSSFYFISFFVLQTKFKDSIINIYLRQSTSILNNITEKIKNDINNYPENYRSMKEIELYLPIIKTNDISHIFIIAKRGNHFFYIKDFSDKDKGYPGMPFLPLKRELKVINKALTSKTPQFLVHHSINTIGFTLYYPITLNDSSDSLIILDYNLKALKNIINLENFIIYSFAAANSIIFLLFIIFYVARKRNYYLSKKLLIDPLTEVYNRNFLPNIEKNFNENCIIGILDIDFFKHINDSFGHDAGDKVLKEVANIIKSNLRAEDYIIRLGGEEFLIVLKCKEHKNEYYKSFQRIKDAISNKEIFIDEMRSIRITVSIGVCKEAKNFSECFKKADQALYKAKNNGRNMVIIYEENN